MTHFGAQELSSQLLLMICWQNLGQHATTTTLPWDSDKRVGYLGLKKTVEDWYNVGPNFRCSETKKASWKMSISFISMGKTTVFWWFNPHSRWVYAEIFVALVHPKSISELLAILSFMPFSKQRSPGKFKAREAGKKWGGCWSIGQVIWKYPGCLELTWLLVITP